MIVGEIFASVVVLLLNTAAVVWLITEHGYDKGIASLCLALITLGCLGAWIMFCFRASDE